MARRSPDAKPQPWKLFYSDHNIDGTIKRVRRSDSFSDQFELYTQVQFIELEAHCKRLGIPLIETDE